MRRMCKFSAIIYEKNIIKVYVLWKHQHVGCKHSFLRKKIVFVEMLCLRTSGEMGRHGDGFSIKRDFYQFWLRSQKRKKRKEGLVG